MLATPLGFVLSLLGVVLNKDRLAGIVGIIVIAGLVLFGVCSIR